MITPTWEHYGVGDDSAYPELWEGCIGAWAPCLGPVQQGVLYDLSHKRNHWRQLTASYAPDFVVKGGSCALYFNGSKYMAPDIDALVFSSIPEFSISVWVAPESTQTSAYFYSGASTGEFIIGAGSGSVPAGEFGFAVDTTAESNNWYAASCGPIITTKLSHIVGTYKKNDYITSWLNGVLKNRTLVGGTTRRLMDSYSTINTALGCYDGSPPGAQSYFTGSIYDCALFDRVLSHEEIRLLASTPGIAYTPRRERRFYAFALPLGRRRRLLLAA